MAAKEVRLLTVSMAELWEFVSPPAFIKYGW